MSTRAIIGYRRNDGTFIGGWQWNDGMGLAPLLRRYFDTIEKVDELIHNGVWNSISSPRDKDRFEMFKEFSERPNSCYYTVEVGKCQLLKERPIDNATYCFEGDNGVVIENRAIVYDSFTRVAGQDCSYVYEFDYVTGNWKTYTPQMLISICHSKE